MAVAESHSTKDWDSLLTAYTLTLDSLCSLNDKLKLNQGTYIPYSYRTKKDFVKPEPFDDFDPVISNMMPVTAVTSRAEYAENGQSIIPAVAPSP